MLSTWTLVQAERSEPVHQGCTSGLLAQPYTRPLPEYRELNSYEGLQGCNL